MGKKLTEDFIRQITEQSEKLQKDKNLSPDTKQFLKSIKLFIEDYYEEVGQLKFLEKIVTALVIFGTIALAFIKID